MNLRKLISGLLLIIFSLTLLIPATGANATVTSSGYYYKVVAGDSLYKISQRTKISIANLIKVNNLKTTELRIGQRIFVPKASSTVSRTASKSPLQPPYVAYYIKSSDTLLSIANRFGTTVNKIKAYNPKVDFNNVKAGTRIFLPVAKDYVTYKTYNIKHGDNLWDISIKYRISMYELMKVNKLTFKSVLKLGQPLRVPLHFIAVRPTKNSRSGQLMDWYSGGQYVLYISAVATVKDVKTGKRFRIKRTYGASHADVETLTAKDTAIMKSIWGGRWSWSKRPVLVYIGNYRIAASAAGMPHAGLDRYPADKNVKNRSDNYGYGPNLDKIKKNNMNGHFDLHFLNSRRHVDDKVDAKHQAAIRAAANVR